MNKNIILLTDSYKFTHWKQYPPKTQTVYSYFESRGGDFPTTVFFGLQYYLKEYLEGQVVTAEKILEAEAFAVKHFGTPFLFNKEGWQYILEAHGGRLPVKIKAVPEGSVVPTHNVLMTVENTDPKCFWLTNYLETLLVQVWYGTTVATQSKAMKNLILKYLEETGDVNLIDFKLHDFGFRGVSSVESAAVGGAAHLVNFKGTDTVAGAMLANEFYFNDIAGFSIPAAEHSTITSWGKDNEVKAFENMLNQFPKGLVAVVSDSYDIFNACANLWGRQLKDKVLGRDGTLVIRPDSGHPPTVVVKVLNILGTAFGYTKNALGYKVLDPHVRVIQGDGIDLQMTEEILQAMKEDGWSADNIAFGMGGALLQKLHRDTLKFAFKCSSVIVNGKEEDVYKEPVTDSGKNSKRGRLKLVKISYGNGNRFWTEKEDETLAQDNLVEVFNNGTVLSHDTFEQIRARSNEVELAPANV